MNQLQSKEQEMSNCQLSEITKSQETIERQNAKIGNLILEVDISTALALKKEK